ncbi:laccase-6-like [Tripterygium wilfordii]|uniref:Laccase-6-like n=1 Tax=Tripterygium wilfordii TaxID=458696 RepID=A0A7J7CHJ4_TRIWF|nr:laccase-6-like [Tripterygium wilfordii]
MLALTPREYWLKNMVQLEQQVLASGGDPPIADAFIINGHPGPNYNCSNDARLPNFNDNLAVKTVMDGLKSLSTVNVPKETDTNLFVTIGVNVQKCQSMQPQQNCQGINHGVMAASMNNISFSKPNVSVLEAYYRKIDGYFTEDFPYAPLKFYDFVNGAPNNIPNDTNSMIGTRTKCVHDVYEIIKEERLE